MGEKTPLFAAEFRTVKKIFAAIDRNDIPVAVEFLDPRRYVQNTIEMRGSSSSFAVVQHARQ